MVISERFGTGFSAAPSVERGLGGRLALTNVRLMHI
jgi:hypothetical protein